MIDYGAVSTAVSEFLKTRDGLNNPKHKKNFAWFVRDLAGIFCGVSHSNGLSTEHIVSFLESVKHHTMHSLSDDGKMHCVRLLINNDVAEHPLYKLTEHPLMYFKPGNTQVGPGEFFFCFYDKDSTYGVDNVSGFDIKLHNVTTEMKSYGSNFTTPELLDKYADSDKVDRLLVVKPVSDAERPQQRSKYVCCDTTRWREVFTHKGKNGSLVLL
jgi:hypothetical protein